MFYMELPRDHEARQGHVAVLSKVLFLWPLDDYCACVVVPSVYHLIDCVIDRLPN
jgi:hypothetical protein